MANCANVAATLHHHLCTHDWHGYTQGDGRWGDGEGVCEVVVDGVTYTVAQGDRDCSSSVIDCWRQAIKGTPYEGTLDGATYTGDMKSVFTASGLFEWKPMSFVAQRGDIYLNEVNHTAMCQDDDPDTLSEFNINEFGGIVGGTVGDQTASESVVRAYYNFPWDGILHYNGAADTSPNAPQSVRTYAANGTADQKWAFERSGSYYRIKAVGCGKYLNVRNGAINASAQYYATPVNVAPLDGSAAQLWRVETVNDGRYDSMIRLHSKLDDDCVLDVVDGNMTDGAGIQVRTDSGTDWANRLTPVWTGTAGEYYLLFPRTCKALDVE